MVEMYEANPHNQAVTEYSAKEAAKHVVTLQAAVAALSAAETGQQLQAKIAEAIGAVRGLCNQYQISDAAQEAIVQRLRQLSAVQ
jgi:hypothetical protein